MSATSPLVVAPRTDQAGRGSYRTETVDTPCDVCEIVREADHRIANHLGMLGAFVARKQRDFAQRPEGESGVSVRLAFESVRAQIDALSRLHRSLATRRKSAPVDLGEYLHQVCSPFISGLSGAIEVTEDLHDGCLVRSDEILPLTQIVSEVLTNAIKYSHPKDESGKVSVACRRGAEGVLEIAIIDDGAGLPKQHDPLAAGGLGFRLIRALTEQIGAQSGFQSSTSGTRFWLRLQSAPDARGR